MNRPCRDTDPGDGGGARILSGVRVRIGRSGRRGFVVSRGGLRRRGGMGGI